MIHSALTEIARRELGRPVLVKVTDYGETPGWEAVRLADGDATLGMGSISYNDMTAWPGSICSLRRKVLNDLLAEVKASETRSHEEASL